MLEGSTLEEIMLTRRVIFALPLLSLVMTEKVRTGSYAYYEVLDVNGNTMSSLPRRSAKGKTLAQDFSL